MEIPGAFCNCGVFCVSRREIGDLLECCCVKEDNQTIRGTFLDRLCAERGSLGADVPQKAADVEFIGFLGELGFVELDIRSLLADILLQLLG